jgi:hypothetical protein
VAACFSVKRRVCAAEESTSYYSCPRSCWLERPLALRRSLRAMKRIDELAPAATLEAHERGIELTVMPSKMEWRSRLTDRSSRRDVGNLLQNAGKFTALVPPSRYGSAPAPSVLIEIEDECGGLSGERQRPVRPFVQRNADRTGLGLGVGLQPDGALKRTMAGSMRATRLRGDASFTVELPRLPVPTVAMVASLGAEPFCDWRTLAFVSSLTEQCHIVGG